MRLIDFHAHVYPAAIALKATQSICDFYDIRSGNVGTPEEKLALDNAFGIEKTLLLPVSMSPKNTKAVNEFVLSLSKADPRFIPFGTVHPADEDLPALAESLFRAGHIGVKLHPDMQQCNADDPRLLPLYDYMQGRMPLYLHAGDPRHPFSHPARIKKIMDMFPRLTVVAAHMGGWSVQDYALPLLREKENCIVDTSSSLSNMTADYALRLIRAYGSERVFFGTDYPVGNVETEVRLLESLPPSDDEKERIAFCNAQRFFAEVGAD